MIHPKELRVSCNTKKAEFNKPYPALNIFWSFVRIVYREIAYFPGENSQVAGRFPDQKHRKYLKVSMRGELIFHDRGFNCTSAETLVLTALAKRRYSILELRGQISE
jgi:hypothetical protein